MFQFLRKIPILSHGSVTPANHSQVMARYGEYATRVKWYFRRAVHTVPNEHIVTQILRHAGVAYSGDDELYYNSVKSQVNKIATSLKINTSVHAVGAQARNSFYGPGISEFLVSVITPYPRGLDFNKYWQTASPLTVRYHPFSDLSFNIPDGDGTTGKKGYAVIEINIPLLMLQFTKWKRWVEGRYDHPPSIQQFVFQYPIVNMAESQYEVAWFNRVANCLDVQPNLTAKRRFGLALADIGNMVDNDIETVIERLQRTTSSLIQVGQLTPMPTVGSLWDWMLPPNVQYTRANAVYHLMAIVPYLAYMAKLSFQTESQHNKEFANVMTKAMREWKNARWFNQPDVDVDALEDFIANEILRYIVL